MREQRFLAQVASIIGASIVYAIFMEMQDKFQVIWIRILISILSGTCMASILIIVHIKGTLDKRSFLLFLQKVVNGRNKFILFFVIIIYGIVMGIRREFTDQASYFIIFLSGSVFGGLCIIANLIGHKAGLEEKRKRSQGS